MEGLSTDLARPNEEDAIAEVERLSGITRRELFDQILEERYRTAEQLATALGVPIALAKRILANPTAHENAIKIFIRSAKVELDLIEIPMLQGIINTPDASPSQKRRAAKQLRRIVEAAEKVEKSAPLVQVNTQINQHFPDGKIETFMRKIDEGK